MYENIIQTQSLTKIFHQGKTNEVYALNDISLEVPANACLILKGASGSGKTTLLTLLSCLARPTSGRYFCKGENVSSWSEKFLTIFRQENIGIIFQHFQLINGMSVAHNIALPLLPLGVSTNHINKKVKAIAEKVGISHRLSFLVEQLSGGEMQRVAIARALVNNPTLVFADEPTAHLDRQNAENILSLLQHLKSEGKTIVMTTHDIFVEKHPIVDKVLTMVDGKLV